MKTRPSSKRRAVARAFFGRLLGAACAIGVAACGPGADPSYRLSHHPADTAARPLRHYPVARQGDLTAWLASDHVLPSGKWLYAPDDPTTRYRIVGVIRAKDMPQATKHDGAFLLAEGYDGPLFELWQGREAEGRLFNGDGRWIRVRLHQDDAVNTWVAVSRPHQIGGWSGYPVVIGDPARPQAVAGAMWYRRNDNARIGGATSTRMLGRELGRLRFADFARSR